MTAAPETLEDCYRQAEGVLSRRVGDALLIFVRETHELLRVQGSALALWEMLQEPRSAQSSARLLAQLFDTTEELVSRDIAPVLGDLLHRGALQRFGRQA